MGIVVAKFGGSSLAEASQFKKVKNILLADENRAFVVPSAPGRRDEDDTKVTDMLYTCHKLAAAKDEAAFDEAFKLLSERYMEIIEELELELDFQPHLDQVRYALLNGASVDYAASRGEYLNGIVLAAYLGWKFIDAAEVIFFDAEGRFDAEKTQEVLSARLAQNKYAVIPGFYGSNVDGTIKTFSRGGSDITGSIVARAVNACLYENWTDVTGFLTADPRIINNPRKIDVITYRELRELSYMGATVLHEDAIFPVRFAGIPINIRNTNAPKESGTMIVASADPSAPTPTITGIAGKTGFSVLNIEKDMMNAELGFGRKVLEVIEECGVAFEHLPSGIDTMSVILNTHDIEKCRQKIIDGICHEVEPECISIEDDLALIAVVGRGMVKSKGTAARLFKACAAADINIRMIDQGSSELNIIIGVDASDFARAQNAIYKEFVG